MTGREFLNLSAIEVKNWLEKESSLKNLGQVTPEHWIFSRKILKWPVLSTRVHGDNDLEFCEIRVKYGEKLTTIKAELVDGKRMIATKILVYRGINLISYYDR